MKKLACLLVFFALGISALMAQSLEVLGYQAVVRDNANKLVTEQNIVLDITISVNSTVEYTETRTVHSNKNGMVSFAIGDADRSSHTNELSDISDWKHAVVQVVYHLTAAQGGDVTTTDPITATPYALQADTASVVNPTYINNVVADSIADPTSEINLAIDTMIQNAITAASLNCDDIADCVTSEIRTNNTDLINAIDSVTYQNTLDSIAVASSELNLAIDTIVGNAFNGLCDSIKNNCSSIAFQDEANNFSEKNTFTDTVYAIDGVTLVDTVLQSDGSIAATDSSKAVSARDLVYYVENATDTLIGENELCDKIEANCTDIAFQSKENTFTDKNTFTDTVYAIDAVTLVDTVLQSDGSIAATDSSKAVSARDLVYYVENATDTLIGENELCDKIEANCTDIAYQSKENTFTEKNTFTDTAKVTGTAMVPTILDADGKLIETTGNVDSCLMAINYCDMKNYVAAAVATLEKQTSFKLASATANQTAFTLTIPTGYTAVNSTTRLVQLYINGVYVGDNVDGVITVSGTAVTYVPAYNDSYALVAGDRIQIVYWVNK